MKSEEFDSLEDACENLSYIDQSSFCNLYSNYAYDDQ